MINCANGGFTHLPRGLKGDGRYATLIMIHNQINTLTEKDMDALYRFKEVDMRDNPLNCTLLHALDYKMTILSDCISKFLSTKPTVTKFNHSTAKHDSDRLRRTEPSTNKKWKKEGRKMLWLIAILPLVIVLAVCVFLIRRRFLLQRQRVIRRNPIELYPLRCEEDDEVILFELKEKRL
ncbi:Hypothetical predicted protein [Paramuricea clavata]|uniref:Uncharacterized protein n=1 Tax=Paramuricea clavata TaxID=317549 RepID=A0A7D9EPH6_PARCT|nr:Hypothetical predicted protein [Paramuricea clavata]